MKRVCLIGLVVILAIGTALGAAAAPDKDARAEPDRDDGRPPRTVIILPFDMVDTSLQGEMNHGPLASDVARLRRTEKIVHRRVAAQRAFEVVARTRVASAIDDARRTYRYLYQCNGCDIDIARKAGADLVMTGWLQKVSNLILNINAQIFDVATGDRVAIGSVSMRGDTDESWRDAARYLIDHRIMQKYRAVERGLRRTGAKQDTVSP